MRDFKDMVGALENLPTLPVVVSRVLQVVEDYDSSANDLVSIIQNDQAIAGKILKVANSAYYGLTRQVSSINHAVVLLGFETVRNLCLGVGVFRSFLPYGLQQTLDLERFWEHTIASAVCARMLWQERGWGDHEELFLSALIHDIGRLALLAAEPREYGLLLRKARRDGLPMVNVEQEAFGGTHALMGAYLCEQWNFSVAVIEPIRHHHEVEKADEKYAKRTAGVCLGNCLSQQRRIGWSVDALPPEVPQAALDMLGLTRAQADALGERLENRRSEIESFTQALM